MIENQVALDELCINTVRLLSVDAVQKANSGHPGMPMGAAPMAHALWSQFLNHNPADDRWPNRDRFVLSAGHGSMLLYSLLHLTGYDLSLDDLKQFRQLHSRTPGHPEVGITKGVEITTGPLGQGFANGVGFAIGQKYLAARYNKPGFDIFDYRVFAICGDGDLMEGISSEAASLAGHLKLGNLVYLYDDNHISIEGDTAIAFTEDTAKRFEAFNWHVVIVEDGNDVAAIKKAIQAGIEETEKPTLIKVRTNIAFGSPNKVGSADSHGAPLGAEEVKLTKINLGWDPEKFFYVPTEVSAFYGKAVEEGKKKQAAWENLFVEYSKQYPELAKEYDDLRHGKLAEGWQKALPVFDGSEKPIATRKASEKALNAIAPLLPTLLGGSADLSHSNNTFMKGFGDFQHGSYEGRNFHFGVREHAMGAIANGIAHTGALLVHCATFLIFSEYMRPPIRLAAIMKLNPIFVYTHDSIGLGEDGTTHQPIEQLVSLRSIPNVTVIRPADANETAQAWRVAIENRGGPVVLVFTRQNLPVIDQNKYPSAKNLEKGAYILSEAEGGQPDLILIGTGSEVSLAMDVQVELKKEGIQARVVSMPSWELFEKQDKTYRETVLPPSVRKRLSIEAGSTLGWHKYVTDEGDVVGIDIFGESAPAEVLMKVYGLTVESVLEKAKAVVGKKEVVS